MDFNDIFSQLLPNLGPWGAVAFLGWWVIKTQQAALVAKETAFNLALAAKDARIEKLTDQVISLGGSTAQALTALQAAVKG
jgi:hypothetical protein